MYDSDKEQSEELKQYFNAVKSTRKRSQISSAEAVVNSCIDINESGVEKFCVLYLDNQNRLIEKTTTTGTVDRCNVYPREIAKKALLCDAVSVIIAHNHPAGSGLFSAEDVKITKRIYTATKAIDVTLLDHILLYGTGYNAMRSITSAWSEVTNS